MKADPILEELWRIKDAISLEMETDPEGYRRRMHDLVERERKAGRIIISGPEEMRHYVQQQEAARALAVREKSPPFGNAQK